MLIERSGAPEGMASSTSPSSTAAICRSGHTHPQGEEAAAAGRADEVPMVTSPGPARWRERCRPERGYLRGGLEVDRTAVNSYTHHFHHGGDDDPEPQGSPARGR